MTGEELAAKREQCGLTQGQLADYLGVGRTTVWRMETGLEPVKRPVEVAAQAMDRGNTLLDEWIEGLPPKLKRMIRLRQQRLK